MGDRPIHVLADWYKWYREVNSGYAQDLRVLWF